MRDSDNPGVVSKRGPVLATPGQEVLPVCPFCGLDPMIPASVRLRISPMTVVVIFCAEVRCRKVLGMFLVHVEEPRVMAPGGRLVVAS